MNGSEMQDKSGVESALGKLTALLKTVSTLTAPKLTGAVTGFSSTFTRRNIINAMLPSFTAGLVNGGIDSIGGLFNRESADISSSKSKSIEAAESVEQEYDDPSDDDGVDESYEELIEHIDSGFEETNESLAEIRSALSDDDDEGELLAIAERQLELDLEDSEDNGELLAINGKLLEVMEDIRDNTEVDELQAREDELERRKALSGVEAVQGLAANMPKEEEKDSRLAEGILGGLLDAAMGYAGIKAATSGLKTSPQTAKKGLFSRLAGKVRGGGLSGRIAGLGGSVAAGASAAGGAVKAASSVAPQAARTGLVSRALGAPLALGIGAYEAVQVAGDEALTQEQKTMEYSKIGGKTAGALAGAKAGAMIGAVGGPIGAAIGGLLGGIGGFFLGEKGGEIVGEMLTESDTVKLESIQQKESEREKEIQAINPTAIVNPTLEQIEAGQTRVNNLQMLTQQIEQTEADKQTLMAAPIIAPVTVNNNTQSAPAQQSQERVRLTIPNVRSQDGTIQRLLDHNYQPLLRN